MSEKHEICIGKLFAWGRPPCAVSVEHVFGTVSKCVFNQVWLSEPTSVISSPWKIKNCPWKVLEFWFDKTVRTLRHKLLLSKNNSKQQLVPASICTRETGVKWIRRSANWASVFVKVQVNLGVVWLSCTHDCTVLLKDWSPPSLVLKCAVEML